MNKKLVLFALIGTLLLGSKSLAAELPASTFYVPIEYDFVDVKPGDWYFSAAKYAKAQGIFNGNDKGEFNPKSNITRAEMAQILYNIKTTEKTNANSYGVSDKWYKPAMEYALSENITSSKIKATDFGAGAQLSRSEVFDMMYSFGLSEGFAKDISIDTNALEVFADKAKVQSENKTAITWLVANKILNGQLNGGKLYLNPSASITRAEVATIMQNLNDYTSKVKSNIDGKSFVIVVKANPTTGYVWNTYDYDKSIIKIESTYESSDKTGTLMGAGGHNTFVITGLKEGTTTVNFKYLRTWEGEDSAIDSFTYKVTVDKNKKVTAVKE